MGGKFGWLVGGLLLLSGCYAPSEEGKARLAQVEAEGKAFDAALDGIEDRMLGNQAKLQLWKELADRHGKVSAIACTNTSFHQNQIAQLEQRQVDKARAIRRGKLAAGKPDRGIGGPRVASASVVKPAPAKVVPVSRVATVSAKPIKR